MFEKSNLERKLTEQEDDKIRYKGRTQVKYFKKTYVMITAAAKMLNHAHFGKPKEVMGLLQGSYHEQGGKGVFVVTDIISLPVEASQTRVTADDQTYTLMAAYSEWISKIGTHQIIGWYHSHPSYGCWLSGIDVNTQQRFQMNTDPFLAIVVDPIKSTNLQKVDMGAFRVHPKNYKDQSLANVKDVPRRKAIDYGYHYQRYYQLPIEFVNNNLSQNTLKNVEKLQWATELSNFPFFNQLQYLTQEVEDEKLDIEEYLELKENMAQKVGQLKEKERSTLKKTAYYAKERNISLIDTAMKSLMF